MNFLVIGSGAREHIIGEKIVESGGNLYSVLTIEIQVSLRFQGRRFQYLIIVLAIQKKLLLILLKQMMWSAWL